MDDLFVLNYILEDNTEREVSFTAENLMEAFVLASGIVKGGEGLLSAIWLTDGISYYEYTYETCTWVY